MIGRMMHGVLSYRDGLAHMARYPLLKFLVLSGLCTAILAGGLAWFMGNWAADLAIRLTDYWPWEWGQTWVDRIGSTLAVILQLILLSYIMRYIVLAVLSPIMSWMSQNIERQKTGLDVRGGKGFIHEMLRGLSVAVRNFFKEILLTLVLLLVGAMLPFLSWLTPVLIFLLQAYYAGFGNMDFTLERYMDRHETTSFVSRHRFEAMGNGAVFLLILFIPVVGMVLAPFFGTLSSTLMTLSLLDREAG